MNRVELIGRLTKDPEVNTTNNGKDVCSFTIAVPRIGQDDADFIDCTAWGVLATNLGRFQHKGNQIGVTGRLTKRSYEDKQGAKKWLTEVICDGIDYLSGTAGKGQESQKNSQTFDEFENTSSFEVIEDDIQF